MRKFSIFNKANVLILLASMLFSACATDTPPQIADTESSNVVLEIGELTPDYVNSSRDVHKQNNCGGNSEVTYQYEQARSIQHIVTVGIDAVVNAKGQVGIPGNTVELGASLALKLGQSYGESESVSRSLTLKAQPGTNMEHTINLIEVWQTGTAQATFNGETYEIPFRYRSDFALELDQSVALSCEDATASPPESNDDELPAEAVTLSHYAFDVLEDFSSNPFGRSLGVSEGSTEPIVENGVMHLDYENTEDYGGRGVYILNYDQTINAIGAAFRVNEGQPNSYTYIQVDLGMIDNVRYYANFGITHEGEVFYSDAPGGEAPDGVEKSWPGNGLGEFNTLIIQWIDDQVQFSMNDTVVYTIVATDGGLWAAFNVGAEGTGRSINEWDWAGWSYR